MARSSTEPRKRVVHAVPYIATDAPRRWMLFVDGENFTFRAQQFAEAHNLNLTKGRYYEPNAFIWIKDHGARESMVPNAPLPLQRMAIRAYYYTSLVGDDDKLADARQRLWELGFHPEVFKKDKQGRKTKGVDITLARDFLLNAVHGNYDAAVLIAGDADYLPIVSEVKKMGKLVYVVFFHGEGSGLSLNLHLASDQFFNFNQSFLDAWPKKTQLELPTSRPKVT